ncbi:MAG: TraI/MobA(P) family conjugative relaxase [Terriglobales bacterium]
MIAKHVPLEKLKKGSFDRLVQYLTGTRGKNERVGEIRVSNCQDADPQMAVLEVLNTQAQNTRSAADRTYHLIVSFRIGEQPDAATLEAIEERICNELGFEGHQRVSVVHHDTDNLHVHIAINKIHPTRYTIHEPFRAYRTLATLCSGLEDELGLQKDNHQARKCSAENRADDMERHADLESLIGWVQRTCKDQLKAATSWAQLHATLAQHGLRLQGRANGLVIAAEDGTMVKASSVAREFSRPKLELRLGPYQAAQDSRTSRRYLDGSARPGKEQQTTVTQCYERRPLASRFDTNALYAQYRVAQAASRTMRAAEWDRVRAQKQRLIDAAKTQARLQRAVLRLAPLPRAARKLAYAVARHSLRVEIARLHRRYQVQRQEIYRKHRPRQWADWLRNEAQSGNEAALAVLRSRTGRRGAPIDGVGGQQASHALLMDGRDSVTKKGTVIYRIGTSALRDDGDRIRVSRGADMDVMAAALRLATIRFGQRLTVAGSDAFREMTAKVAADRNMALTFADVALEHRRQQLAVSAPECAGESATPTRAPRPASGRSSTGVSALDKYITEREQRRAIVSDIPKHVRYTALNAGAAEYAGCRHVDGQILALLKRDDEVMVLAVDDATARRLRRLRLGAQVGVNAQGVIGKKGRSR